MLACAADCSPSHQLAVDANFSLSFETSPILGCALNASSHSATGQSYQTFLLAASTSSKLENGLAAAILRPNSGDPQHFTNTSAASAAVMALRASMVCDAVPSARALDRTGGKRLFHVREVPDQRHTVVVQPTGFEREIDRRLWFMRQRAKLDPETTSRGKRGTRKILPRISKFCGCRVPSIFACTWARRKCSEPWRQARSLSPERLPPRARRRGAETARLGWRRKPPPRGWAPGSLLVRGSSRSA